MRSRALIIAAVLAVALASLAAGTASAAITAYNEPAYTKTATTDRFWWRYTAVNGLNLDTNQTTYLWWMCLNTWRNGIQVEFSNGTQGWNSTNCFLARNSSAQSATGDAATYPFTTSTVLEDGAHYQMCVTGYHIYGFYNSYPSTALLWDNFPSPCNSSTIDRSPPSIGVGVNGDDEYTNNPVLDVDINYNDAISPPWFGSDGRASNWVSVSRETESQPGGAPDAACSNPRSWNRTTGFDCTKDVGAQPDGKYYVCVKAADAAVLDNPSGPNQFLATSDQANISGTACGWITLDRQAPAVAASADATTVTTGQLVKLSASASDPAGIGAVDWDFGDNTAHAAGVAATHTYTQAGTYVARASTTDGAGNTGSGTVTMTVSPATSGPVTPVSPTPTPVTPIAPSSTGSGTVTQTQAPLKTQTVSQSAGGGGTQTATVAGLKIVAPKRFVAGRRSMTIALTARNAGTMKVSLRLGHKGVSKAGATFSVPGTFAMKLQVPRKLKPGSYVLQISFKRVGAKTATTRSFKVRVVRPRSVRVAVVPQPRALEGVPAKAR